MGTQLVKSKQYGEQEKRLVHMTRELPQIQKVFKEENGEQPAVISQRYTMSMYSNSHLRKMIDSLA